MVFPVVKYGCESCTIKKAECRRIHAFKTLESPLDSKEIKPVNPKGNQPWIFIGRIDAEAPILWLPDAKIQLFGKDPDTRKDWKQEEKKASELDGWMASPTQWTWAWASSGRWWRTGKPGVMQSMGSQRVGHSWLTEQQYCSDQVCRTQCYCTWVWVSNVLLPLSLLRSYLHVCCVCA